MGLFYTGINRLPILRYNKNIHVKIVKQDDCVRAFTKRSKNLIFSPWEFVWAHLTAGHPFSQLPPASHGKINYVKSRTVLMCGTVEVNHITQGLQWSPVLNDLDPSEKTALSYSHGMAITKLVMAKFYDTSWACHFSMAHRLSTPVEVITDGTKEPDLLGLNGSGAWVVGEAKGRQVVRNEIRDHVRAQLCAIEGIQVPGETRLKSVAASIGSFLRTHQSTPFDLELIDPPGPSDDLSNTYQWRSNMFDLYVENIGLRPVDALNASQLLDQIQNSEETSDVEATIPYIMRQPTEGSTNLDSADQEIIQELRERGVPLLEMPDGSFFLDLMMDRV